jgi:hypothetical protein
VFAVYKAASSFFAGHVCGQSTGAASDNIWWVIYSVNFSTDPFGSTGGNDVGGGQAQADLITAGFYYNPADQFPSIVGSAPGTGTNYDAAADSPQATVGSSPFYVGINDDGTLQFDGDIMEVLVCVGTALTPAQVTDTVNYLNAKFGIVP